MPETITERGITWELPPLVRRAVEHYIQRGWPPGSFVGALLRNDLHAAVTHADPHSLAALPGLVFWLAWHAPEDCWGTPDKVEGWLAAGGLEGWSE
jgi:hypothetical protein